MPDDPVPVGPDPASWNERLQLLVGGGAGGSPPLRPGRTAAGAAAVVAVVVLGVVLLRPPPGPGPEATMAVAGGAGDPSASTTPSSAVPTAVVAHAAGAVAAPGVYRLPAGGRVADLVDAAGGPLPGADLDQVNLAAAVADGERVYVPVEGEVVPASPSSGPPGAAGPVDLNTATAEQLDTLPGVGPSTAAAILAERDRRGRFGSVDELLDVRGIGPAKLEQLRELVRV